MSLSTDRDAALAALAAVGTSEGNLRVAEPLAKAWFQASIGDAVTLLTTQQGVVATAQAALVSAQATLDAANAKLAYLNTYQNSAQGGLQVVSNRRQPLPGRGPGDNVANAVGLITNYAPELSGLVTATDAARVRAVAMP